MECRSQETVNVQALQHIKQIYLNSRVELKFHINSRLVITIFSKSFSKNKGKNFDERTLDDAIYSMTEMHCSKFQRPNTRKKQKSSHLYFYRL